MLYKEAKPNAYLRMAAKFMEDPAAFKRFIEKHPNAGKALIEAGKDARRSLKDGDNRAAVINFTNLVNQLGKFTNVGLKNKLEDAKYDEMVKTLMQKIPPEEARGRAYTLKWLMRPDLFERVPSGSRREQAMGRINIMYRKFRELFPNGGKGMSEEQIAEARKKFFDYMEDKLSKLDRKQFDSSLGHSAATLDSERLGHAFVDNTGVSKRHTDRSLSFKKRMDDAFPGFADVMDSNKSYNGVLRPEVQKLKDLKRYNKELADKKLEEIVEKSPVDLKKGVPINPDAYSEGVGNPTLMKYKPGDKPEWIYKGYPESDVLSSPAGEVDGTPIFYSALPEAAHHYNRKGGVLTRVNTKEHGLEDKLLYTPHLGIPEDEARRVEMQKGVPKVFTNRPIDEHPFYETVVDKKIPPKKRQVLRLADSPEAGETVAAPVMTKGKKHMTVSRLHGAVSAEVGKDELAGRRGKWKKTRAGKLNTELHRIRKILGVKHPEDMVRDINKGTLVQYLMEDPSAWSSHLMMHMLGLNGGVVDKASGNLNKDLRKLVKRINKGDKHPWRGLTPDVTVPPNHTNSTAAQVLLNSKAPGEFRQYVTRTLKEKGGVDYEKFKNKLEDLGKNE